MSSSIRALLRAGYRDLLRRPLHSLLMLVGVSLGVAVVVAIDLANQSARRAFELSTESVVGKATHRVVGGPEGLPETLYFQLRQQQFGPLAPVIDGVVSLDGRPVQLLGIDPFAEQPFRQRLNQTTPFLDGFAGFYTAPGQAILTQSLAEALVVEPGDQLPVQANGRIGRLTILGVLQDDSVAELAFMDLAGAQELIGASGRLSRIDVIAEPATAGRLEAALPTGIRLESAGNEAQAAQQLTAAFSLNLTALSLLALVVGMFLIYNTMSFSVLRRRMVFGTLRTLGVSGGELRFQVLFEAILIGAVGSLCGILLGWALSKGAVALVSQTINDFYFLVSVRQTALSFGIVGKSVALGLLASVFAAGVPAWEASRVPPVQVLRRSQSESHTRSQFPALALAGLLIGAAGVGLFWMAQQSLPLTFAGMMLVLIGLALLVPVATDRVFRRLARLDLRPLGRMALRGVSRHISRTGIAVASLMVALSVAIGVTLMIDSFRTTVENWLAVTLQSDLYISEPASVGTRPQARLPAALQDRIQQVPGVETAEAIRAVIVDSEVGELRLSAVDAERVRDARIYRIAHGSAEQVWRQVTQGSVLVSESLAYRSKLQDQILLYTDRGGVSFPVAGVFYDYSTDQGTLLVSRQVYQQYWDDPSLSSIGVTLSPGESIDDVADRIRQELSGTGLAVVANAEIRQEALKIFDRTFAITSALRVLAVVVAVIGVISALLALQLERAREYATLSALGLEPQDLQRLTLGESALLGTAAAIASVPTGVLLALALIYVINARSFGWTIWLNLSAAPFVQAMLAGVGAALIAAVYPVLRVERVAVAAALSQE